MSDKHLPSLLDRHWAESALAIGAVIIAAVSLWVAYDSERTNRQIVTVERRLVTSEHRLVAENAWPFVQVYESDSSGPPRTMSLALTNSGIGPAKLEFFQLFWNGKAQSSPQELLRNCCGKTATAGDKTKMTTSADEGIMLRPGQTVSFLRYAESRGNASTWAAFHSLFFHAGTIRVRYCYCSAFNQCWLISQSSGTEIDLNPPRVRACSRPEVTFNKLHARAQ